MNLHEPTLYRIRICSNVDGITIIPVDITITWYALSFSLMPGFGRESAEEGYEIFQEAMAEIGVLLCRHIHHPTNRHLDGFRQVLHAYLACTVHMLSEAAHAGAARVTSHNVA